MGIEPMYKGFADPCLTTWLPGHLFSNFEKIVDPRYFTKIKYFENIGTDPCLTTHRYAPLVLAGSRRRR